MELVPSVCYQAVLSHDRRFDGLFFTCVASTGIYCRPVCAAPAPKPAVCTFVPTAAAAEKAGYRPCLRCRPEHAPAGAHAGQPLFAARQLADYIDQTLLTHESLAIAAKRFHVSERHLRRQFVQAYGAEPRQYLTTRRLLFAKQLLQDTALPVANVAYASGFNTPGRLAANMRKAYGFTPARLRGKTLAPLASKPIQLRTDYRPPFNWTALLCFLQGRATPLERVENDTYYRVVDGREIVIKNDPDKHCLRVQLPAELSQQAHAIIRKVRALFDLDANPLIIEASLSRDPLLGSLISRHPGVRVPGCWDNFEMLLRVIVGQQVSVAGATTIMKRLVDRIGITQADIAASWPQTIAAIGMPLKRGTTIWKLGAMVQEGTLSLDEKHPERFYEQLVALPGIGPWTAEYMRMRVLRWPDAFPAGDLGLQKAVVPGQRQTERVLAARAAAWQPWRSYATMLLWKSLENKGG